jgi:uncharacterized protein YjdB
VTVAAPDAAPVNLWVRVPSGTAADLFAIGGGSPSEAFASGANGVVLRLGQNGAWTPVESGTTETLTGLWALAPSNVVVAGGRALRGTWNTGADWVDWPVGSVGALANVWGASWTDLFAVGQGGTIVRFRNGTAEPMTSGVAGWLWGVYGTSASNVVAVGAAGAAVRFDGTTWAPMSITGTPNLLAVWGTGPNSMYAGGEGVWHWNGSAWSLMPGSGAASGIWGAADNDIYTVTGNGDIQRYDGSAWHAMTSGTTANLHAVWGTGAGSVYAVGDGGTILRGVRGAQIGAGPASHTLTALGATVHLTAEARAPGDVPVDGAVFAWASADPAVATVDSTGLVTAVSNGTTTITVSAPGGVSAGIAVTVQQAPASISLPTGYGGGIGGTWTPPVEARDANNHVIAGQTYTWASLNPAVATVDPGTGLVTFVGMGQAVIVAQAGSAMGYTSVQPAGPVDPVNLWAPMANPAGGTLTSLWGTSRTSIYAGGTSGLILHYDGAGWSQMASPATGNVLSMGGFADSLIWAGENNHPMLRFNGHSWSSEPDPGFPVEAIGGYHPRDLYIVGGGGSVRHYDGSSWSPITSGTLQALLGVYQVTGPLYVVGQAGTILRDWVAQAPGLTTANLKGIWGQPNRLYAVGTGGTILRTWDEGPWSAMTSGTAANLSSVTGTLSDRDVYAVGDGGTILRFDGAVWVPMASGTTADLSAAWTAPDGDVYVVGTGGTILRGVRGAAVAVMPAAPTLTALGVTYQFGAIARDPGGALIGGVTFAWSSDAPGVATVDGNGLVTAVGNGTATISATAAGGARGSTAVTVHQVAKTMTLGDPGITLNTDMNPTYGLNVQAFDSLGHPMDVSGYLLSSLNPAVATVAVGVVSAVGAGQTTITGEMPGGAAATVVVTVVVPGTTPVNLWRQIPRGSDYIRSIWGFSATDIFAVGDMNTALRYDGAHWMPLSGEIGVQADAVWGASPNDVWAAGQDGTWHALIAHFDGTTWTRTMSVPLGGLWGLWGSSARDVFAVGESGGIYHYDGASWSPMISGTANRLWAVWGSSARDVFAVGELGTILHYDGDHWSPMTSGTSGDIRGLWGTSSTMVFATVSVGAGEGALLRFNGGGWSRVATAPAGLSEGVWGASENDLYAGAWDGVVYRFDGSAFSPSASSFATAAMGIWGTSAREVYAGGTGGVLLQGYRGATVELSPANPGITGLGNTLQLTATAKDAANNLLSGVTITWTSGDTGIAAVDSTGRVTAVAAGSATITAIAPGGASASTTVTVSP